MHPTTGFSDFTARLREYIRISAQGSSTANASFEQFALELFALQHKHNEPYRRFCEARGVISTTLWQQIPAIPTSAFKEFNLSSLPAVERTTVFHSSGTTGQIPSRHFHNAESLAIYEASMLAWFSRHLLRDLTAQSNTNRLRFCILTPPPSLASNSSLVHMFQTVLREFGSNESAFFGRVGEDRAWTLALPALLDSLQGTVSARRPIALLGTAFSFVNLLDHLVEAGIRLKLPAGSRAMETGGYKGRSRTMPKSELHRLISLCLGIPPELIITEYGMSELSSQAYDRSIMDASPRSFSSASLKTCFQFPAWCRAQVISPETDREAREGETGLLRIIDLANVYSVMAIQTEDLAVRRGHGFELIGRAAVAEPRGCSLLAV